MPSLPIALSLVLHALRTGHGDPPAPSGPAAAPAAVSGDVAAPSGSSAGGVSLATFPTRELAGAAALAAGAVIGPVDPRAVKGLTLDGGDTSSAGGGASTPPGWRAVTYAGGSEIHAAGDPLIRLARRLPGFGVEHALKLYTYELLRATIPALHTSISKRRFLEGVVLPVSDDPGLQRELRQFARTVPVGDTFGTLGARGVNVYADALAENADAYGLGFGEIVVGEGGVERLALPHPRTFEYRREEGADVEGGPVRWGHRLYQNADGHSNPVDSPFVNVLALSPAPGTPWGRPLAWGMESTAEIILRMLAAVNDLWFRSGSPSEIFSIEPNDSTTSSPPSATELQQALDKLQGYVSQAMQARASGHPANVFFSYGKGKVNRDTLGDNLITKSLAPYLRTHYTTIAGQLIANADVPAFLYPAGIIPAEGLGGELPARQTQLANSAAVNRNVSKLTVTRTVLDTHLATTGASRFQSGYRLSVVYPSLSDPKDTEDARERRENANQTAILNASALLDLGAFETEEEAFAYLRRAGVMEDGGSPE